MDSFEPSSLFAAIKILDEALKEHLTVLEPVQAPTSTPAGTTGALTRQTRAFAGDVLRRSTSKPVKNDVVKILQRAEKVKVSLRIVFLKIDSIDTIHDRYAAEVLVQARWREPSLDGKHLDADSIDWEKYWNPNLKVENGIHEPKSQGSSSVTYDNHGHATVCDSRKLTGSFHEFMELNQFPFDSQDLTITMVSERDSSELELREDEFQKCGINTQASSTEQEWRIHQMVNVWRKDTKKVINKMTIKYPALCVAAKASRRPQFFIWNIIVIMFSICSLAFVTFTVEYHIPHSRLPLTFFLLLTTVTFKFVVNKSLPKISYLTYLDKYILGSMVILIFVCIWHGLIGSIISKYTTPHCPNTTTLTTSIPSTSPMTVSGQQYNGTTNIPPLVSTNTVTIPQPTPCDTTNTLAILADRIAFGIFTFVYVGFHIFFAVLIVLAKKDENTDPNVDIEDEDAALTSAVRRNSVVPIKSVAVIKPY